MKQTDEFKVLGEQINSVQATVDIIDRDLAKDREDMQEFTIRLGKLEEQVEALRKGQITMVDKVGDKISEVTEPIREGAKELQESIDSATFTKVSGKKKHWWKKFGSWILRKYG